MDEHSHTSLTHQETLTQIQEMAGVFMPPREIAYLIGQDPGLFLQKIEHPGSPEHKAYMQGRLQAKYALRKKVVSLALMGSPQAEILSDKYIEEQEVEDGL